LRGAVEAFPCAWCQVDLGPVPGNVDAGVEADALRLVVAYGLGLGRLELRERRAHLPGLDDALQWRAPYVALDRLLAVPGEVRDDAEVRLVQDL
jgi:hypothetical protein